MLPSLCRSLWENGRGPEGRRGAPSPPAPLPRCGRGGSWLADSVLNPTESKFSRGDLTSGRGGSWLADSVLNPTESKFSRGDLTSGRGGSWLADSVSLTDAGAGSPLLCYPPSAAPCGRTAGGRRGGVGRLTPSPSPALRERGELVSGLSIKPHGVEVLEG
jgi:hypothetical protein